MLALLLEALLTQERALIIEQHRFKRKSPLPFQQYLTERGEPTVLKLSQEFGHSRSSRGGGRCGQAALS